MAGRVEGKVALITGAGAGTGAATARKLAAEGAKVVVVDWDAEAAERVAAEIAAEGLTAREFVGDASEPATAAAMVEFAVANFGSLEILHNQVFALHVGKIEHLTIDGWNEVLRHTVTATFLGIKNAIPVMRRQGFGSIINTASVVGFAVEPGQGAYATAKAGVINLTRYAAIENARHGIRVNSISPGVVESDGLLQAFGESKSSTSMSAAPDPDPPAERTPEEMKELRRALDEAIPLGAITKTWQIADLVLFLGSEESSAITGSNIVADGGVSILLSSPTVG